MSELEGMINGILSNPDQMKKIMDIAGSIMGGGETNGNAAAQEASKPENTPNVDDIMAGISKLPGGLASAAQKLMGGALNTSSDKTQLLEALKPWLSEKRRSKLESAMKAAKVMKVAGSVFLKNGG